LLQHNLPHHLNLRDCSSIQVPNYLGFPAASVVSDPSSYQEAANLHMWKDAISAELHASQHTSTWDVVPLPPDVVPITCKWVYKVKTKAGGSIELYKARLVARAFQQSYVVIIRRLSLLMLT
jgi:hypothetical protein